MKQFITGNRFSYLLLIVWAAMVIIWLADVIHHWGGCPT